MQEMAAPSGGVQGSGLALGEDEGEALGEAEGELDAL